MTESDFLKRVQRLAADSRRLLDAGASIPTSIPMAIALGALSVCCAGLEMLATAGLPMSDAELATRCKRCGVERCNHGPAGSGCAEFVG
jgi:hypothetical protein